ncbi:transglycosylase SLT domain-containing protein [Methylobacterium organophilum]|uniref:Transglycosylase SLT domain-containing protein n=1 Tax=Methylobacterium organophilum TaxID=410 RepID=A0ABQ4TDR4_METOR|nr:transglycosylase SLT domain-containing protein [Methylobacterium organophilum]GJE28472.1 hypothetical protein LKMONMHP_3343 [Methylobacterium organophilum]
MGVHPEPARRADDVSRLVSGGSLVRNNTAGATPRHDASAAKRSPSSVRRTRRILASLALGLSIGGALPQGALAPAASAHDGGDAIVRAAAETHAVLRPEGAPADWGGVPLLDQEPATLSIIESDLAGLTQKNVDEDALRFGDMSVSRGLVETILRAAADTGVDPVYMMALADKESSFDTDVKSSASSAQGLFQFVTGTWLELVRSYGAKYGLAAEAAAVKGQGGGITIADPALRKHVLDLRNDPYVSGLMAGELIKRDRARIEARIGRELKTTELYLAHFLGTASAGKFLSLSAEDPEKVAKQVFGRAARANRSIFTEKDGKKRRALTVAEVHERLDAMIDRRMSQYEGITALASQTQDGRAADAPVLDARLRSGEVPTAIPTVQ